MPVVDRNGPVADAWVRLADEVPPEPGSTVIVSLKRLAIEHNALFASARAIGVEITGDVALEDLLPNLPRLGIVVVRFTTMRDGRPFSIGRLLRERHRYTRELRASGDFVPDQVLFLLRCGFNSFELSPKFPMQSLRRAVAAYTAWYQRGSECTATVIDLRHRHETACEANPASAPIIARTISP